ncbi:MAG: hypothetical protein ACPGU7_03570 [Gammaproteobacteria bacterium]
MSDLLAVLLDGVAQLEYDRAKPLPPQQELYLDKMDEKMAQGIEEDGTPVADPDMAARVRFVAANLVHAIQSDNEAMAAAMCAWLALRQPDLKQVKVTTVDGGMSIDLDYENAYGKQVGVSFTRH